MKNTKSTSVALLLTLAIVLAGCAAGDGGSGRTRKDTGNDPGTAMGSAYSENNSKDDKDGFSLTDVTTADDKPDAGVEGESKDSSSGLVTGGDNEGKEISNAEEIWRVYRIPGKSDAANPYLYLDIFPMKGTVVFEHAYYMPNTYNSADWPFHDGDYWVTTYDAMGGAGDPDKNYIEYSKSVIKIYGYHMESVDGQLVEVRDEYPDTFELISEDILK